MSFFQPTWSSRIFYRFTFGFWKENSHHTTNVFNNIISIQWKTIHTTHFISFAYRCFKLLLIYSVFVLLIQLPNFNQCLIIIDASHLIFFQNI